MSRSSRILKNLASNWIGFAVTAGVTLLLTPFVLHTLGDVRYGVWVISSSLIGYYGLLDLGFRGSINQYLTRYLAVADYDRASATISTAVVALSTLGAVFALLSVVTAYLAPAFWNFPANVQKEAFWCILIVGLTTSLQFVFFPYMSIFVATQRLDIASLIGVATRLLTAGAVYLALQAGFGLIGISAATCATALLDYVIRWRIGLSLAPNLKVHRSLANRSQFREMARFGVWTFLIAINSYVYLHSQPLIAGIVMPISAVGHYALATALLQQVSGLLNPIGQVIYPAAASIHAQSDRTALRLLYHHGTRLMLLAMTCVVVIGAVWAEDFYRIWIGPQFIDPDGAYASVALLLQILLISSITSSFSNIGSQILTGSGRVPVLASLLICGSIVNLTISITLIEPFGLLGLAAATVIASVIIDLIALPLVVDRVLGLGLSQMLKASCVRPLSVAALLASGCIALRSYGPIPQSVPQLIAYGIAASFLAALLVFSVGITSEERHNIILHPIKRLLGKR